MTREALPVIQGHPEDDRFGRDRQALRLPAFLKRSVGKGSAVRQVKRLLRESGAVTVCEEAKCPNLAECFAAKTATFMLMGENCTRACGFCAVGTARPEPLDPSEPERIATSASALGLAHVVLTSVNRDDLDDGGAQHIRATVLAIKRAMPNSDVEVLIPDFMGDMDAVRLVAQAPISVLNHNIETVPRLYRRVRPRAAYQRSLNVLAAARACQPEIVTKSGLMVGFGESYDEVVGVMKDLKAVGVNILTIGQYLRPSIKHVPVVEYLRPDAYDAYRKIGRDIGFDEVFAGPFV
ncbi:MAG: lipoyl synthase, partial [Myxococcota bacterium]|nr:lipoyl synthase [Myxococcota bacterium]